MICNTFLCMYQYDTDINDEEKCYDLIMLNNAAE